MTRKLEELFNMGGADEEQEIEKTDDTETKKTIQQYEKTQSDIDIIDAALPMVKDLESNDKEMDEIADAAKSAFNDLMDLGMNVEARYAGKIYESAAQMLGHQITAKNAKIDKKLKMIEMQLKKRRLDQQEKNNENHDVEDGNGVEMDRNALLKLLRKDKS